MWRSARCVARWVLADRALKRGPRASQIVGLSGWEDLKGILEPGKSRRARTVCRQMTGYPGLSAHTASHSAGGDRGRSAGSRSAGLSRLVSIAVGSPHLPRQIDTNSMYIVDTSRFPARKKLHIPDTNKEKQ